jgi:hypothetical protein
MSCQRRYLACALLLGALAHGARANGQAVPSSKGLVIKIEEPEDWSRSGTAAVGTRGLTVAARSSIRVSGTAQHPLGVAEVYLNKNRASSAELPDGTTQFVGYVRVEDKMTSAEITVVTKTNARIPVRYSITPTKPLPPAATPKAAWEEKAAAVGFSGKRYAVIIGISKYEDKEVIGLKYADEDAKAFYDFLRSPLSGMGGFEPENIQILLNEAATYRNMKVALFDFLKNATENDVVYIYYAGHGAPDPDRRDNLYLLPYDTKATQIGGTGFPMEDMNKALRQVTAAHKVLIIDACHSGGVTTEGARGALEINDINNAFLTRLSSSKGVHTTFTASGANQTSMEGEQWGGGHGVFTYYLLQGLSGAADENQDHIVDLGEMMKYTLANVERVTARKQIPKIGLTAYNPDFPVALVLPGQEIRKVSAEEIAKYHKVSNVMTAALESAWIPPDSLTLVAGVPDTLRVLLQNDNKDVLPPTLLRWTSSNNVIAKVDENGVVTPLASGTVQISASREGRKVATLIKVLPRASDVVFAPAESNLQLVLTESFRVKTDLLIGTEQWVRDMAPRLTLSDTLTLRQQQGLEFVAYREGTAKLTASIAGRTKEWNVRVIPPGVRVKPIPVAIPINDSLPLGAWRVRPDGSHLGDAANVVWRSTDTTRAAVRNGQLMTRGIGKSVVVGTLGNSSDSVTTFVLGDLLVGTNGDGGDGIVTIALANGQGTPLLPKGVTGSEPALSPQGDRIAFVSNKRLHVMNTDGSNERRLTPDMKGVLGGRLSSYEEHGPTFTNDGSRVVFVSNAPGNYEVLSVAVDGSDVKRLTNTGEQERNVSAAPDAPQIAFERIIASDEADIVVALPDGSQDRQFHNSVPIGMDQFRTGKPKFMPGATELVYVKRWGGRGGESLHLMDVLSGGTERDLVPQLKDNALVFAVSPDGQRIAFHRVAEWGRRNDAIVIIDRSGGVLKTLHFGEEIEIKSMTWGASPLHTKDAK